MRRLWQGDDHEIIDPADRLVARAIETRSNTALERAAHQEKPLTERDIAAAIARRSAGVEDCGPGDNHQ
ncbi:hypothetical protein [Bradyrhizobium sp. sBnM-33]|uniref:hypothetical protein n=1 Tax=Bradyrhizobium sp. sBnM-33 TaxID=2831780 RepID=UPI001BCFA05D|nr:hypothetical protein [Bradyrhizobium sp. sBnM-33]WOH52429.1 hypothetical protein RX328_09710 [Bradyrhizobium sp. sBnM-33]